MQYQVQKGRREVGLTYAVAAGRALLLLLVGNLALVASARLEVPFWPVPMTLETFAVLVIAATYGRRLAIATVGLFLVEGAAGLPVFAGGGGPLYFVGTTGGYLIGFALATVLIAWLMEHGWKAGYLRIAGAMFGGTIVVWAVGVGWLGTLIGWHDAVLQGLVPFALGDIVKVSLAALTVTIGRGVVENLHARHH